jgi:hypothetical protein
LSEYEEAKLGADTKQALEVLEPAIAKVRAALIEKLVSSTPTDTDAVMKLLAMVQVTDAVREALGQAITNGEVAAMIVEANNQ